MNKILTTETIEKFCTTAHEQKKQIVLVGGCFDVLHLGHISFLEKAKAQGDLLLVLLESDETIKKIKGDKRPINTQKDRALMLSALAAVDGVVLLHPHLANSDYDALVNLIKPAIIATTAGDSNRGHREQQAAAVGAKLIDVVEPIANKSTTKIVQLLRDLD